MRVNECIAPGDELGEGRVCQPVGEGTVRIAWEAPVEVLTVIRYDERAARPERRQVKDGHSSDNATQVQVGEAARPLAHRRHRSVLAAVHSGDDSELGPVGRPCRLDHRHLDAGQVERAAVQRAGHGSDLPITRSTEPATVSRALSAPRRPASWSPTGNPAVGTGNDTAGWPVRLYGPVNRASALSSSRPNGGSSSGAW